MEINFWFTALSKGSQRTWLVLEISGSYYDGRALLGRFTKQCHAVFISALFIFELRSDSMIEATVALVKTAKR